MSIKLVSEEIRRFLKTNDPEVICIMGKWGVGKTFAWNQYLQAAIADNSIAYKRYSYTSLFGQNSLDGLKSAIFENTVNIDQATDGPSVETFRGSLGLLENKGRWLSRFVKYVPQIRDYLPAFFLAVRKQIICIDDLERIGDGFTAKEVLGLVSFLKDQRGCKVVLLLNDEELDDQSAEDFKNQLEKVIDVEMRFEPTPLEAVEIGVDKTTSFHEKFSQTCIALSIVNIRVIRKIQGLAKRLEELLANHDKRIFDSVVSSMILFGWATYQPKLAPSIPYLKEYLRYADLFDESKKEADEQKKWRLLISGTDYAHFDELDQILLDSIQRGYFDKDAVEKQAIVLDKKFKLQDQDSSFHDAWEKYHNSFAYNDTEVLDGMYASFKKTFESISPSNLDGTVGFFRKFGRDKEADEMVDYYMKKRKEEKDFYDSSRSMFLNLKDPKLAKAFTDRFATFKDTREPEDIIIKIARNSGWNPEDISALAKITADEYYEIFKKNERPELRGIVTQTLRFKNYDSTNAEMIAISKHAEEALKRIAKESPMNRERVKSYGVTLDDSAVDS